MRRRAAASLLAIPFLIFDAWGAEARRPSPDEVAVREVVETYFNGMMEGSPEKLRCAFHPDAVLVHQAPDGSLTRTPATQWAVNMNRGIQDRRGYRNEIAAIDISGNAAMVKTVLTWPRVKYVDYLSLLRNGDGEWRIVNKVWDSSTV